MHPWSRPLGRAQWGADQTQQNTNLIGPHCILPKGQDQPSIPRPPEAVGWMAVLGKRAAGEGAGAPLDKFRADQNEVGL